MSLNWHHSERNCDNCPRGWFPFSDLSVECLNVEHRVGGKMEDLKLGGIVLQSIFVAGERSDNWKWTSSILQWKSCCSDHNSGSVGTIRKSIEFWMRIRDELWKRHCRRHLPSNIHHSSRSGFWNPCCRGNENIFGKEIIKIIFGFPYLYYVALISTFIEETAT